MIIYHVTKHFEIPVDNSIVIIDDYGYILMWSSFTAYKSSSHPDAVISIFGDKILSYHVNFNDNANSYIIDLIAIKMVNITSINKLIRSISNVLSDINWKLT